MLPAGSIQIKRSSKRLAKSYSEKDENKQNYDNHVPTPVIGKREVHSRDPLKKTITSLVQHVKLYETTHTIVLREK